MSIELWLAFVAASAVLLAIPGPTVLLVISYALGHGKRSATATVAGLGWALLPTLQSQSALEAGRLVRLGGDPIDVPLYWQQWNLRSVLLDAVAAEIVDEGRRVLAV